MGVVVVAYATCITWCNNSSSIVYKQLLDDRPKDRPKSTLWSQTNNSTIHTVGNDGSPWWVQITAQTQNNQLPRITKDIKMDELLLLVIEQVHFLCKQTLWFCFDVCFIHLLIHLFKFLVLERKRILARIGFGGKSITSHRVHIKSNRKKKEQTQQKFIYLSFISNPE